MSHSARFFRHSENPSCFAQGPVRTMRAATVAACMLACAGFGPHAAAAIGNAGLSSRAAPIPDEATFHAAVRQQHQVDAEQLASRCEMDRIGEAVSLIHQQDDLAGALAIAAQCERLAIAQGRPDFGTVASRIRAIAAIKVQDMAALRLAGETLVSQAQSPESTADGHLFIAFACTFSGQAACARTHLDQARSLFTRHEVAGALEQLMSVEQALLKLESPSR